LEAIVRSVRLSNPALPPQQFPLSPGRKDAGPAAHQLIESCQGLVRVSAWQIHQKLPASVDLEDLIGYGQVGLAEAARDFDPSRGNQFSTYAWYRVRGAIFDGLSQMSWFKLADYHNSRYQRAANDVLALDSQDSTPSSDPAPEVGWLTDMTAKLSVAALAATLVDTTQSDPADTAGLTEMRTKLRELIDALPEEAGRLIRLVYFDGLALGEAGKRLGISKAWASRLHAKTLQRLARAIRLMGAN
jgi:RNA polymerase sigma factor FliA